MKFLLTSAGIKNTSIHKALVDVRGKTFEDPDGYRVVLQNANWP